MSHLTYYNYEGVGKTNNKEYSYSQAVRVGNTIKCSGQGGWDSEGNIDKEDLKGQIDLAFRNVEKNLKDAGARGWADVHSVRSYHISLSGSFDLMVEQFRKWMPDHQPTWTCVGVTELGIPDLGSISYFESSLINPTVEPDPSLYRYGMNRADLDLLSNAAKAALTEEDFAARQISSDMKRFWYQQSQNAEETLEDHDT
ncbi:L-PSP endoribonuclease family [Fusarium acutatum]|uniref:L-PSP endoribonuclease family n=1 Tax=Fusarium acutatum TaxID=78861 RepID=A0A8H4NJD8_9HYPO|nr:L-PSP endoribonuclease family [Fusarium acutatum]